MVEGETDEIRYKAFLSYSHRDAPAAARLHRRLESYRIPRRLIGRETVLGTVPDRLWPVFRDRDELPASSDLSELVKAALARSDALVVLCSPDAAGSRWIAREIETFRALHPDRPVLAAILAGEPGECFPAALRGTGTGGGPQEPLATDLRAEGDGPQLGLLKLVAGITGLGLDDLVQRDASRRVRRVTAVTVAALIGMLITAALALVALDARREAERQRAEAEGLIEFMLTDLREKLRGNVGQLDVMQTVNRRALAYYADQEELRRLRAESLERRARVLHAMGEDDVARGDLAAALRAFQEAHRVTAEQLARAPNDPDRIFAHAQSEYWVGRIFELRREWPSSQRQYAAYARAAERLIRIDPSNADYMMEMGWGALNNGIVQLNGLANSAEAQRLFERSVRWFTRAAAARPGQLTILREQANAYGWLADSYFSRERWRESLNARRRQYLLTERIYAADPSSPEGTYRLAIAQRSIGRLSALVGDAELVVPSLESAYRGAWRLTQQDPENAEWQLFRAKVECDMLRYLPQGQRSNLAISLRRSVHRIARQLAVARNPRTAELAHCLSRHGLA